MDNCCSKCITNCFADFTGVTTKVNARISAIGGPIYITRTGTVRWKSEDDIGHIHIFIILGTLYAPKAPCRMLSPQHWSQTSNDILQGKEGTWRATHKHHDKVVLHWNGKSATGIVWLDSGTNVATFRSASGMKRFMTYRNVLQDDKVDRKILCLT